MAAVATACTTTVGEILVVQTGVVIAVDGPSAAQVDRITLRGNDGSTTVLTVGALDLTDGGLPAPHLREHLVSGEPITAYSNNNVLRKYTDAE